MCVFVCVCVYVCVKPHRGPGGFTLKISFLRPVSKGFENVLAFKNLITSCGDHLRNNRNIFFNKYIK